MTASSDKKSGSLFQRLQGDVVAGLVNAVASVPSSMATAAMAGVNPVYGLYAITVAPATGGLLASSQRMQIATNGASALTASQAIVLYPGDQRAEALFMLVGMAGIFLIIFGLLKAGRLLRYISYPVMVAFLSGVAAVLVLDQSSQLLGYTSNANTSPGQFIDLLFHLGDISLQSAAIGLFALAIIIVLSRTAMSNISSLVALVIPTVIVVLWQPSGIEQVSDVATIPQGLPPLGLPDFTMISTNLILSALALAVVIAIQGAGISQSYANPDGRPVEPSRDMFAQGAANVAGSLVSGMPTGGSVSQTALNVSVGAKSRLAGVFHSIFMLVIILLVPGLVSLVPMPVLASVMIVAGFSAIRFKDLNSVWRTAGTGRWVMVLTFFATLILSVPAAVTMGIAAAIALYLYSSGSNLQVRALEPRDDGRIHVTDVPNVLPDRSITVLEAYGSLFFAAATRLGEILPAPGNTDRPVVILRLRGNSQIGATVIDVLNDYAHELAKAGGLLYLNGMDEQVSDRLERARRLELDNEVILIPATDILGESTRRAIAHANTWLRPYREDDDDALAWPENEPSASGEDEG